MVLLLSSYLCVALAAICNAVMDKVETEISFNSSIFSKYNPLYWSKVASWRNIRLKGTKYPWNAWHNFKSGMVVFMAGAMVCFGLEYYLYPDSLWDLIELEGLRVGLFVAWNLSLIGTIWIQTFNLFYNHIFYRK